MSQSVCFSKIIEFPTFHIDDHNIASKFSNHCNFLKNKTNIIYRVKPQIWQGAYFLKFLQDRLENKGIFFFLECECNYGEVMAYMRMGIKKFVANNNNCIKNKRIKKLIESLDGFCVEIKEFKSLKKISILN